MVVYDFVGVVGGVNGGRKCFMDPDTVAVDDCVGADVVGLLVLVSLGPSDEDEVAGKLTEVADGGAEKDKPFNERA